MKDKTKSKEDFESQWTGLDRYADEPEGSRQEHKSFEKEFQEIEKRYRNIFENAPVGIFRSTVAGKAVEVNPEAARILGYDSPDDIIALTDQISIAEALYVDPESRAVMMIKAVESKGKWIQAESRLRRKDNDIVDARLFFREIPVGPGDPALVEGFLQDISEQKRLECLLRLQRDLARGLGSARSMDEAMELLLESALQVDGIDAGGVYVLKSPHEELRLVSHAGLSSWFSDQVFSYGQQTPQMRLVMQGEPIYCSDLRSFCGMGTLLEEEGFASVAVIPINFDGRLVAVLNLASRTQKELNKYTKQALEAIAAGIGGIVFRVEAEEALRAEREHLAEANAALKVILRQRTDDQTEVEEALLTNVESLVTPYVEKLMKTRLTPIQSLFVETIGSNLKDITSSFLQKLSRQFAHLTPMEIQVASLVKEGRSSKEIAQILGISHNAVLFHRKNMRGKLGLKHQKVNLHSYLSSL